MLTKPAKRLLSSFIYRKRHLFSLAWLAGLLSGLATLLVPLSIGKYYSLILHTNSARGKLFDALPFNVEQAATFYIFFATILVLHFVSGFFARQLADLSAALFAKELREHLFARHISRPLQEQRQKPVGRSLLRYSGDMGPIKRLLSRGIVQALLDFQMILLGVILLFMLNAVLASVILLLTLLFALVLLVINQYLLARVAEVRKIRSSNLAFVSSRLQAQLTIQLMKREKKEWNKFARRSDKQFSRDKALLFRENLQKAVVPGMMYALLLAVMISGQVLLQQPNAELDGSTLLVFIMFLISIIPAFRRLMMVKRHWRDGGLSLGKIAADIDKNSLFCEGTEASELVDHEKISLEVKAFTTRYEGREPLRFPAICLKKGESLCLRAPSGSGKTMLLEMIVGIREVPQGSISINGTDISELPMQQVREMVALHTPAAPLLGKTVSGVLGNPGKSGRKQALELLRQLGFPLHKLPENLKLQIGEQGSSLSTGEKRILQLVRSLIQQRPIMLFDDPFTGLSAEAAQQLKYLLAELGKERIVVLAERGAEKNWPQLKTYQREHVLAYA